MKKQLRYWMSGCVAVISLALGGIKASWADDVDPRAGHWQTSRFDMAQTLQRLQACAPQHGLSVFACWSPTGRPAADPRVAAVSLSIAQSVLVFATRDGGTPVLMSGEDARPDLPLSLRLRVRNDGRVEVQLPSSAYVDDLPHEVACQLTGLPGLVAQALT